MEALEIYPHCRTTNCDEATPSTAKKDFQLALVKGTHTVVSINDKFIS
jgi:hypothetical protein